MGRNSIVTKQDTIYEVAQGPEEFSDYRRWYLNGTEKALSITNDFKIARIGIDGSVEDISPALSVDNTSDMTLCVNRNEDKAYILYFNTISNKRWMKILTISDMSLSSNITSNEATIPLRAIISRNEKIVWLGDDGNLYKMDLNGENLEAVSVSTDVKTFILSADNYAYTMRKAGTGATADTLLARVKISDMTIEVFSNSVNDRIVAKDGFCFNGHIYFLAEYEAYITANAYPVLVKIPENEWNVQTSWQVIDLETAYGILKNTVAQFCASGADNYATFSEDNGTDRQRLWQCNLTDLSCRPARVVAGDKNQFTFDGATDIKRIEIDITKANNGDQHGLFTSAKGPTGGV